MLNIQLTPPNPCLGIPAHSVTSTCVRLRRTGR